MPKILSVEDEPDIAELIKRYLVEAGYEVLQARNRKKVFEKLRERPDLILMDIGLDPNPQEGWEINRLLKEDEATASIPVIAVTAHAQHVEHRERALREGFVDHVSKPILDFDALLRVIATALETKGV